MQVETERKGIIFMALSERNQTIVLERAEGEKLEAIAQRHGVSHQRVSTIYATATEFVNKVELDLLLAAKTGDEVLVLIPQASGSTTGVAFADWLAQRLRDRGLMIRARTHRAHNGVALLLEDLTYASKEER